MDMGRRCFYIRIYLRDVRRKRFAGCGRAPSLKPKRRVGLRQQVSGLSPVVVVLARSQTIAFNMAKKAILFYCHGGFKTSNIEASEENFDLKIFTATSIDDVKQAFAELKKEDKTLDHVVIGNKIEVEERSQIIQEVFKTSGSTTVHVKDRKMGP